MPADFIPARVCILICEIILTLPSIKNNHEELIVERDRIVVGTDIVEIDESVLDGLAIPYLSADGKKMEQLETIYWNNNSWHVLLLN